MTAPKSNRLTDIPVTTTKAPKAPQDSAYQKSVEHLIEGQNVHQPAPKYDQNASDSKGERNARRNS